MNIICKLGTRVCAFAQPLWHLCICADCGIVALLQKAKGLSVSQNSESDFDNVVEEKIKKLKMRNSELVAIARKLEEKAKQLQEEKDLLEVS